MTLPQRAQQRVIMININDQEVRQRIWVRLDVALIQSFLA